MTVIRTRLHSKIKRQPFHFVIETPKATRLRDGLVIGDQYRVSRVHFDTHGRGRLFAKQEIAGRHPLATLLCSFFAEEHFMGNFQMIVTPQGRRAVLIGTKHASVTYCGSSRYCAVSLPAKPEKPPAEEDILGRSTLVMLTQRWKNKVTSLFL